MRHHAQLIAILSALLSSFAAADPVSMTLDNGIPALADYRPGEVDKPALIVLHGFLQTSNFHTIHSLAGSLNDEGYTVLAPTLSLKVPNRKKSLACEAIHTHTLADELSEIGAWIDWLAARGHDSVVFVGHSSGSMMLLAYLEATTDPRVREFIGISIVESRMELPVEQQIRIREELQRQVATGERALVKYPFSYCKPMQATAASLLSYLEWTPERILEAIQKVGTPQFFIMGSVDDRLGKDWIERLQGTGKTVHVIEGANHFMGGEYEFALADAVMDRLQ